MPRELRIVARARSAVFVGVAPEILRGVVTLVFKHHVYVADALQVESAKQAKAHVFMTETKSWRR
jgi:predicted nucleic acid-binding protein